MFISIHIRIIVSILQECDSSLKHKTELVTKLEAQNESLNDAIQQLHNKLVLSSFCFISNVIVLLTKNYDMIQYFLFQLMKLTFHI